MHSTDLTPEDNSEPYPLCGLVKGRPRPNFKPYHDVFFSSILSSAALVIITTSL